MEVIGAAGSVNKSNRRGTDTWNLLGEDLGTGDAKDATFLTDHQEEVILVREGESRGGGVHTTNHQASVSESDLLLFMAKAERNCNTRHAC